MLKKMKRLWNSLFSIDYEAIRELDEILQEMDAKFTKLSKEDRKRFSKSLKK